MGNVGGVQLIELALEFDEVLAVDQVLDPLLVLAFLTVGQVFDQLVPMQQIDHLGEAILQAFLRLLGFYFGHGALHPSGSARHRGSDGQIVFGQRIRISTG
ncbi:hypothetical protein D9M69_471660 [compost metagenome]